MKEPLISQSAYFEDFEVGREMRTAGRNGLEFLLRAFCDKQFGGWVWSVTPEGSLLEDHKDAYGHAFVLLALAWGGKYLSYEALTEETIEASEWTWQVMQDKFADGRGGFRRVASPCAS